MTKAAKCDRCGKYYDINRTENEKVISPDGYKAFQELALSYRDHDYTPHTTIRYDLCPECRQSFKDWLLSPQAEEESDWVEC